MTIRAIGGLVAFNAVVLVIGAGALWGIRGWRWWSELARLAGVAYLLGLALLMIVLTLLIVLGVPVTLATLVVVGAAIVAAGLVAGRVRGHSPPGLVRGGWRFPRLSLFEALFLAGLVVYLEGLFRSNRLSGVVEEWDSWAFWMPKAARLYHSGGLDAEFLQQIPSAPYPPGLTSVHAAAFHFMGGADSVTLHLQHWFFAAGFVAALAGLLAGRVSGVILFPVLLAVLASPSLVARTTTTYADLPLGYLVAVGALLVALWLHERSPWQLASATVLLAGAMLTKREGMLFVAAVLTAALLASWRDRRALWPRLLAAGGAAFALVLPWRVWFSAQGIPGDGPEAGYVGSLAHLDRVRPSLALVLRTLFDQDLWPVVSALAVGAILLAAIAGVVRMSVYVGGFVVMAVAACTWAIWSNPSLEFSQQDDLNPIVRLTGTTFLALAALTPVLLQRAWSELSAARRLPTVALVGPDGLVTRSTWAWSIVAVGLLSHPGAMLVGYSGSGLPGGLPTFPSADECVSAPTPDRPVRLVVGYTDSYPDAHALRTRALAAGLEPVQVAADGCGRVRVFVDGLAAADATRALEDVPQASRLEPTLEADVGG